MSGWDVMKEINSFSSSSNLKGIALSGYGMEEDIKKSIACGFQIHLTKPGNSLLLNE